MKTTMTISAILAIALLACGCGSTSYGEPAAKQWSADTVDAGDDGYSEEDASYASDAGPDTGYVVQYGQFSGRQAFTGDGFTDQFGVLIPWQPDTNYVLNATVLYASGSNPGAPEIKSDAWGVRKGDHGGFRFLVRIDPAPLAGHVFEVDWIVIR